MVDLGFEDFNNCSVYLTEHCGFGASQSGLLCGAALPGGLPFSSGKQQTSRHVITQKDMLLFRAPITFSQKDKLAIHSMNH